jgi:hypothetical protein
MFEARATATAVVLAMTAVRAMVAASAEAKWQQRQGQWPIQTVEAEVKINQLSISEKRWQIGWQKCGGGHRWSMAIRQW